jgi:magnesium chelatase subunit D
MSAPADVAFPFSALVGQEGLRAALLVNAVNPAVGGVLVRGEKGTAKSTAVRALARLLPDVEVVAGCPFSCDPAAPDPSCPSGAHPPNAPVESRPARLVELPVGASADRLAGSLDLERALVEGVRAFEPGLLAAAHRGVLYVDEVNLLADHLVDLLLDAAALGVNYVERESVSVRHAARFLLVGTMNPEEGELRPQLLDRFGLSVDVQATRVPAERAEVVRRQLAFELDPVAFAARFAGHDAEVGERIARARALLPRVRCPDALLARIAAACAELDVDGLRADIVTAKAATALAALDGRDEANLEDVREAALLALAHRRRRGPLERPGIEPGELDRALAGGSPDDEGPPDGAPPPTAGGPERGEAPARGDGNGGPPPTRPSPVGPPQESARGGQDSPEGGEDPPVAELSLDEEAPAERASDPAGRGPTGERTDPPAGAFTAPVVRLAGRGRGTAGRRSPARSDAGRPIGAEPHRPGQGLAALATMRAAAPRQRARGRAGPGLVLAADDLRSPVHESREGNLVLFVVDASGSMAARRRMAAVKGAVLALLVDAYQRRDLVGLVSFRGEGAEVLLPPTASVEVAAERLAELPTGGRTPTAVGIDRARELLRTERMRDPRRRALVFVVTDGRANAGAPPALDGAGSAAAEPAHRTAPRAAERAAATLAADGAGVVVLDTEEGPARLGLAARLAAAAGGACLRLEQLEGERIAAVVRASLGRAA